MQNSSSVKLGHITHLQMPSIVNILGSVSVGTEESLLERRR